MSARPELPALHDATVSIVICNHNYAQFLEQALASALAQTLPCQVIVVDDGSTDGSRALLEQVDPGVVVLLQPNGGQNAAYNSGFERCNGQVVMFLDADDVLEPNAAAIAGQHFGDGVAKVHFRMTMVDADGRALGGAVPSTLAHGDVFGALRRSGLLYPSAPGSGNAYRRSVLQQLFPLPVDADDRVGADFFTIYGSVTFGSVSACEIPLARYRLHGKSAAAVDQLVFGNASLSNDESIKVSRRYQRMRAWLAERTQGKVVLPPDFLDFSVQKSVYAAGVFTRTYRAALFGSAEAITRLLRSLWLQPAYGLKKKLALSAWAVLVLAAPRSVAFRLAQHVCNPASRHR